MIHTIEINENSQIPELKKLFRKKLMTGGAVVRLAPGLDAKMYSVLFERFKEGAEPNSLQELVLRELVKMLSLSKSGKEYELTAESFRSLGLKAINAELEKLKL